MEKCNYNITVERCLKLGEVAEIFSMSKSGELITKGKINAIEINDGMVINFLIMYL